MGYLHRGSGCRGSESVLTSGTYVDFVFSDINMPGSLNGQVCRAGSHAVPRRSHLLTSGEPQPADALYLGKNAILAKPYDGRGRSVAETNAPGSLNTRTGAPSASCYVCGAPQYPAGLPQNRCCTARRTATLLRGTIGAYEAQKGRHYQRAPGAAPSTPAAVQAPGLQERSRIRAGFRLAQRSLEACTSSSCQRQREFSCSARSRVRNRPGASSIACAKQ